MDSIHTKTVNGVSGKIQNFQGGAIFWTAAGGAMPVLSNVNTFYKSLQSESGSLGWPTAGPRQNSAGNAWEQPFQNGRISWSYSIAPHVGV
jgi:uncharacterized protein with LGFP repeats